MRQAKVFSNGTLAGILTETDNGQYEKLPQAWLAP